MRKTRLHALFTQVIVVLLALLVGCSDTTSDNIQQRSRDIPAWFDEAKLGIFIHWGPASVPGYAHGAALQPGELEDIMFGQSERKEMPYSEWYLNAMNYPDTETARYHAEKYGTAPYDNFIPIFEQRVASDWNPSAWAELFERAGARYVVLVTKHHDGYTLWPSGIENPHRGHWSSSRDMVGELAEAVRARGMRFGTYYSTGLDWTFQLVTEGDRIQDILMSAPASQEYADYVHAHMSELIDRYSPDVLWADIGYPSSGRRDELMEYYFNQVPEGTVNDRWGSVDTLGQLAQIPGAIWVMKTLGRLMMSDQADNLQDDPARYGFKTAEYDSFNGVAPFKWETTRGLGASFAYNRNETAVDMLSGAALITFLIDSVAKNGNVLINVGPDSYGHIPVIQQTPLLQLGNWLSVNGEAIYNTKPWQRATNLKGRALHYTHQENALYAIVNGPVGTLFTVEDPNIHWESLSVLGAEVVSSEKRDGLLTITLTGTTHPTATVVRYQLP